MSRERGILEEKFTRRKVLGLGIIFLAAACSGGDLPDRRRSDEGLETNVPYLPQSILIIKKIELRKLPQENAEMVSHPKDLYIANPLAFDPTGEAYKPNGKRDNLWLGFPYKDTKAWFQWISVRDQFIVIEDGKEVIKSNDILFGGPGEKPNEIKLEHRKPIRIIVIEQEK